MQKVKIINFSQLEEYYWYVYGLTIYVRMLMWVANR